MKIHRLVPPWIPQGLIPLLVLAAPAVAQESEPAPAPPSHAFLWKVEKEGQVPSYLFGTMHTPDPRVNSLHPEVKRVLKAADAFYSELPLDDTSELEGKMMEVGMLPAEESLDALIGEEATKHLGEVLGRYGMPAGVFNRMRPFMAEVAIGQLEMMPLMAQGKKALDVRLYLVSKNQGKEVGGVETIDEQIQVLAHTRTQEEAIDSLRRTLKGEVERDPAEPSSLARLTEAYLSGSEARIWATVSEEFDFENEADLRFYEALLPKRNVNMAVRSARLMEGNPEKTYVFAYGTLHFIGRDSVPDLLREQGYTVTRLLAPPDNEVLLEEEVEEAAEEALDALGGQLQGLGGSR